MVKSLIKKFYTVDYHNEIENKKILKHAINLITRNEIVFVLCIMMITIKEITEINRN